MKLDNLNKLDTELNKMALAAEKIRKDKSNNIQLIISEVLSDSKEYKEIFTSSKKGVAHAISLKLQDKKLDSYTKRALKVASKILVDGYKMKKELLSLAQMEQLICFDISLVNALMSVADEFYLDEAKDLINKGKITKNTKVFSKEKAKKVTA